MAIVFSFIKINSFPLGDEFFLILMHTFLLVRKCKKKDKLYWFYDELMIENYIKIKEVLNNSIELEHFLITGTKLQISKMDGYLLVIKGQIMMVRRKNDEHL